MMKRAKITATTVASHGSNRCEKSGSPRAPIASEVRVTPSCIAAMKRGGSAVMRRTARARRFPSRSSSRILVRLEVTSPYSAATKAPLSRIRTTRAAASMGIVTGAERASLPRSCGALACFPRSHPCYPSLRIPILTRTYVLYSPDAGLLPHRAVQVRDEPGRGDAVRLVAQPVHGLRAPLHVLL